MPLLIDGHNLIARLPDLHLDDPVDEVKLVERLRRYQARTGRRLTVVFDRGLPGGFEPDLSTGNMHVIFAATGRSADALIIERVRRSRDARGLTIVTSDQRIITTVEPLGARVMPSEIFAAKLTDALDTSPVPDAIDDVLLSQSEVNEWLAVFEEKRSDHEN